MSRRRALIRWTCFVALFVAAVAVSRLLVVDETRMSLLWPAGGVIVLWVLLAEHRIERLSAGIVVFAVITPWLTAEGFEFLGAAIIALANVVLAELIRLLVLRRDTAPSFALRDGRTAFVFLVSTFAAVLVTSVLGMVVLLIDDGHPSLTEFAAWFLRYLAGVVLVAGCGLGIASRRGAERPSRRDVVVAVVVTLGFGVLAFAASTDLPLGFVLLFPLLWTAIRMPLWCASVHAVLLSVAAGALVILLGGAAFADASDPRSVAVALQVFITAACSTAIIVAAAIGESGRLNRELRRSHDNIGRLFSDAPQGIAVLDRDGVIRRANPALAMLLDRPDEEVTGQPLGAFGGSVAALHEHLRRAWESPDHDEPFEWEPDSGAFLQLRSRVLSGTEGGHDRLLINFSDLSERRLFEQQLNIIAEQDHLTGLANRRRFDVQLAAHRESHRQLGTDAGLLLIDLDRFKEVNDTLGHHVGDELLVTVAEILKSSVRSTDLLARLGGDEFAVILEGADLEVSERVALELVDRIHRRFADETSVRRHVTASVGAVTLGPRRRWTPTPWCWPTCCSTTPRSPGATLRPHWIRAPGRDRAPEPGWNGSAASTPPSTTTSSSCTCSPSWTFEPARSPAPKRCCAWSTRACLLCA